MTDRELKAEVKEILSLPNDYWSMIRVAIDSKGVYPHQAIVKHSDGKLSMMSLAVSQPQEAMMSVFSQWIREETAEVIYALDRVAKPGQDTTLGDLVAGGWWDGTKWKPFIIEYQHEPRIVKEINWENEFWNAALTKEFGYFDSLRAIRIEKGKK